MRRDEQDGTDEKVVRDDRNASAERTRPPGTGPDSGPEADTEGHRVYSDRRMKHDVRRLAP